MNLTADKHLQDRARKLRLWSSELAKPGMTAALAAEHLADTLADYERYMSAHNLKFVSGAVKAAVSGIGHVEPLRKCPSLSAKPLWTTDPKFFPEMILCIIIPLPPLLGGAKWRMGE